MSRMTPGRLMNKDGARKMRKINGKTIKRLLRYILKYKGRFALVILCILTSAVASVASSLFLRTLIDDYITPMLLQAAPVFTALLKALAMMGTLYIAGIAATFIYARLMVTVSQGVLKTIRDEMFGKMQSLPIRYFDTHTHGDVMSHYTNDADTLRQMISQSIPQLISSAVTIIAVICAMLILSGWLTLLIGVCVLGMLKVVGKLAGKSSSYFAKQQKSLGGLNGFIEEMIHGQKVVKVFCHEEAAEQEFDGKNEELRENVAQANKFANILMPVMGNMGYIQYVLVAVVGGVLALSGVGGLTLGTIISFLQLSRSFNMPISQVSQQLNSIVMALAGAERIFELMDEQPEQDGGEVSLVYVRRDSSGELEETRERTGIWAWKCPQNGGYRYVELKGDVRFFDVDFGYAEGKQVLHDVSLYAKPGQKIAFVGATGAGKTTITNLINRFYDISSGDITYDGIDVKQIRKDDLRQSLGMVLQDVNLFTGTVRENIRYGKLDATDEEVEEAAKLANAHDFITRLPEGYDTVLQGDGSGLSQGQRQLLSIARAAVADPPVMILDEATSSIDTRTEAIVQNGMDKLMHGRTVFVIAHRLSTVQNANAILVLEQGKVVERGDHEDLMATEGRYYQLYTGALA